MSIVKIVDDYLLQFGNQRFFEGWNGQKDYVIKLLEDHAIEVDEGGGCSCKCGFPTTWDAGRTARDYQDHLLALIKGEGENKHYPLPLPPKTKNNTEPAPLSRPMKFKGEK